MPRSDTHLMGAAVPYLAAATFQGFAVSIPSVVAAGVASQLCDLDTERSLIGSSVPVAALCRRLGVDLEHQGALHSLTFVVALAVLASPLLLIGHLEVYLAVVLAVLGHEVLDSVASDPSPRGHQAAGIQWLWPFTTDRFLLCPNQSVRLEYGSRGETYLRWTLFALTLALLAVNVITPRVLLNSYYADARGAVELTDLWHDSLELVAEVDAVEVLTNNPVRGTYGVVGVKDGFVVLAQDDGSLVSLGDGYDTRAVLRAGRVRILRREPVRVEAYEVDLSNQSLGSLTRYVAGDRSHRLFSELLKLEKPAYAPVPSLSFNPVEVAGTTLRLYLATLKDLEPFRDAVVEQGIATVRYRLKPGEHVSMASIASHKSCDFELSELSGLRAARGRLVVEGDVLAVRSEYLREIAVKERRAANSREELAALHSSHQEQLEFFRLQRAALLLQLQSAGDMAQADEKLAEIGAIPVLEAGANRIDAESLKAQLQSVAAQEAQEIANYEARTRELELLLLQLKGEITALQHKASVQSPYTGVVEDIITTPSEGGYLVRLELREVRELDAAER